MVPQLYAEQACLICNEAISNPICMHCLEKEMLCWVADKNNDMQKTVKMSTQAFYNPKISTVRCILCNRRIDVCPHCYSKEVAVSIFDEDQSLAEEFIDAFDFDLK